ncbi:MAG: endonuclease III [Bacilli bacterium]|nr:endonuclease III [Bacilli bacterium]
MNSIVEYLDYLFPNPRCELNYNKDYELLISVMLSAQTTDKMVNKVTSVLYSKYDTLEKIADADISDIKNIIKPLGNYNKKASNIIEIAKRLINDTNGVVVNNRTYLETLPGVGRKTTNVVLANLYNENVIAVDTHVARVSKRLGIAKSSDDVLIIEKKLNKKFSKDILGRLHHQLVLFGRYYCKAKNPKCNSCSLCEVCKYNKKNK